MTDYAALNERLPLPDERAAAAAKARFDSRAMPVGSLGEAQKDIVRIAALTGSSEVRLSPRAVCPMCADNGCACEDVASTPVRVTRVVAELMARGESCVCRMGRRAGIDVIPTDVGMRTASSEPNLRVCRGGDGTGDITRGPAMTRDTADRLIAYGMALAGELAGKGCRLLITGEMGVGNTMTSAAMASVLLRADPALVTGRGAGLTDERLARKVAGVRRALDVNRPDPEDAMDVLCKVGGFDIAAMCGLYLGGALHRVPVLIDGVISAVAALTAYRLCPRVRAAMIATHVSAEPAGPMLLGALSLMPLICAGFRLGEGTGAVTAVPMLDMALTVYEDMCSFADIGMA